MKKTQVFLVVSTIFCFAFFNLNICEAQNWHDKIPEDTSGNFYKTREAYYKYWKEENYAREKHTRWKQFKRWENSRIGEVDADGNYYKATDIDKLFKDALFNRGSKNKSANVVKWKFLGPDSSKNGIGRVNCITFSPVDTNTIYLGTPSGGFWRSYNYGKTWETTTDAISSIGVSSIAIPPDSPNVIYISTGDKDLWYSRSIGLLKSYDGGTTWNPTGLTFDFSLENRVCGNIRIDPINQSIVHVYSNQYYYRSTNAGNTFTAQNFTKEITSMVMHPTNPLILYLGTTNGKLYRTINGGLNWTDITSNLSYINPGTAERATLCVNPSFPDAIYFLSQGSPTYSVNGGVYVSKNTGNSFQKLPTNGVNWFGYTLAVSSTDTNVLFAGGTDLFRTTDKGNNWTLVHNGATNFSDPTYLHVDMHDLVMFRNKIYSGNDGGLGVSDPININWKCLNGNLAITHVFGFGSDVNDSSKILFGAQDIGSGPLENGFFNHLSGGDGMECAYDQVNSNIYYLSAQNGAFYKTTNNGATFNVVFFTPQISNEYGAWTAPILLSKYGDDTLYIPHVNLFKTTNKGVTWTNLTNFAPTSYPISRLHIPDCNPNIIYIMREATAGMFRSVDAGATWQLLGNAYYSEAFGNFDVSNRNPNTLFATTLVLDNNKKVYKSTDGGLTWQNYSGSIPNVRLNAIVYQKNSKDRVFVGTEMGVYYRDSTMSDWVKFGEGLPNIAIKKLEIHELSNKLRVGTFGRGLWEISLNGLDTVPNIPLPLQFIDISAESRDGVVEVKWITANEKNIDHFEIEKYSNQNNWAKIGTLNKNEQSLALNHYKFIDDVILPTEQSNTIYYRVKQLDCDEKFSYSKTVSVNLESKAASLVYPNPSNGILNIYMSGLLGEKNIELFEMDGKRIQSWSTMENKIQIGLTDIKKGVYFLRVYTDKYTAIHKVSIE